MPFRRRSRPLVHAWTPERADLQAHHGGSLLFAGAVIAQTLPPMAQAPPRAMRATADLKSGTAVVSGRVTDAETGDPLARVTVSLTPPRDARATRHEVRRGRDIRVQAASLPGAYSLTADPIGSTTHRSAGYGVIAGKPPGKHSTIVLRDGEVFDKADIALPRSFVSSARASSTRTERQSPTWW